MASQSMLRLGGSAIKTKRIEIVTIKDFLLQTSMSTGANNDGTGSTNKKGLKIGEKYRFKAITDKPLRNDTLTWVIKYTSPNESSITPTSSSKNGVTIKVSNRNVTIKSVIRNENCVLNLAKELYLDMAGCELTITCYITNQPNTKITKKFFVHNRFMYFDRQKVSNQVTARRTSPWKIDQGQSSLCGMACLYYIFIQRDANAYKKVAMELHRTGIYKFNNGYVIKPVDSMYEVKPSNNDFKSMRMTEADWITLASTRSSESSLGYDGIESGSFDQLGAVNWMDMLTRMCEEVAGYSRAKGNDLSYTNVAKTIVSSKYFSVDKLVDMDNKYNAGKKIIMMIQPNMLYDKRGTRAIDSIHWVVYEGGLQFFDGDGRPVANDSLHRGRVAFKVFTWGYNPSNAKNNQGRINTDIEDLKDKGIAAVNFSTNYYGYIEVK